MEQRDIGNQVKAWRLHLKLTQSEVEGRASLSHNTVSRIETGLVSPRFETVESIARAMGISVEELQFRSPSVARERAAYPTAEELVARLDGLPEEVREDLVRTFHSLVDLVEKSR